MVVLDHLRLRIGLRPGLVVIGRRVRMRRLAASALVVVHAGLGFGRRIVVRRRTRWVLMPSGTVGRVRACCGVAMMVRRGVFPRSEEHTSELQSLMRISYAVFCLKKKKCTKNINTRKCIKVV